MHRNNDFTILKNKFYWRFLLYFLLIVFLLIPNFIASKEHNPLIRDIKINGNFPLFKRDLTRVIQLRIGDEYKEEAVKEAIKRISGRVSCKKCREGYNLLTAPRPKEQDKCDKCGGELIKRADDYEEAVKKRLKTYHQETEPILEKYKSRDTEVLKINGEQSIEKIAKDIEEALSPI